MRAVLLGLAGSMLIGLFGATGTAAASAEATATCGGKSSAFAKKLPQVRPGQSGTYVMGLQKALAVEEYPLVGTGYYGPKTLAAVRDFQAKHGIKNSGIVGIQTWHALVGTKPECRTMNGKAAAPNFGMLPGDRDENRFYILRDRLSRIMRYEDLPKGEEFYGPGWQAVVKNFQRANGIHASGIVGPKTWRALNLVISISGGWGCGC